MNTTSGNLVGNSPGNHFIIDYEGAYTNVTGIKFHNTQLFVRNTTHVTLDNISVIDEQQIGGGIGGTAIRANATYITVKNSYFNTKGSVSTMIALTWADYCTIDNCTIISEGSGNLLYLNKINIYADVPEGVETNIYNNITNCRISGGYGGISLAMVLAGKYTTVINNTLYIGGISGDADATIINNTLYGGYIYAGNNIINNTVHNGIIQCVNDVISMKNNSADLFRIYNNGFNIENNTGNFELQDNTLIKNNNIKDLTVNGRNNTIINNTITGTVNIKGSSNNLSDNNITGYDFTPVTVTLNDNKIVNNYITSYNASGNDCVRARQPARNTIENNTPEPITGNIILTEDNYSEYFDTNGVFNCELVENNTNIILKDTFNKKNFTFKNLYIGLSGQNATLYNSTIILDENTHMGLNNITIDNSLYNGKNSLIINSDYNRVDNFTIYQSANADIETIKISNQNNRLFNNSLIINSIKPLINVNAIEINDRHNNISNNTIKIDTNESNKVSAIDSNANNNTISYNNIIINSNNNEAIKLNNSGGNTIMRNTLNLTGINTIAITATEGNSSSNNISSNNIYLESQNNTIGILIDTDEIMDLNYIHQNSIYANSNNTVTIIRVTQNTTTDYSTVSQTDISMNKLYANGSVVMGIVITAIEPKIDNNQIYVNATTNETQYSDDYIHLSSVGILIQNSSNIYMSNNYMDCQNTIAFKSISSENGTIGILANTTNSIGVYMLNTNNITADSSLKLNTTLLNTILMENTNNNIITRNQLNANDTIGGDLTVTQINSTDNTVENNGPILSYITNDNFYEF